MKNYAPTGLAIYLPFRKKMVYCVEVYGAAGVFMFLAFSALISNCSCRERYISIHGAVTEAIGA